MEDTCQSLASRLKQARREAQLKQEQVARYLKLPTSAVSAMERGKRAIEAHELYTLARLYGKPLDWFFDELAEHQAGVRWYDNDPLVREVIFKLKQVTPDLRRRAAYGLLGFLES